MTIIAGVSSNVECLQELFARFNERGELDFTSGGNHLMFEKLTHKPKQGEKVSVQLHFAKSGTVTVEMPVKSATYNPSTGH